MYRLEVYVADKNGEMSLLNPKEIQSQVQFIMNDADRRSEEGGPGVNPGIFTSIKRAKWAEVGVEVALKSRCNFCLLIMTTKWVWNCFFC